MNKNISIKYFEKNQTAKKYSFFQNAHAPVILEVEPNPASFCIIRRSLVIGYTVTLCSC